jgi:peptidoglycan/LPS O-acetylase OafA/YrhL
VVFFHIRAFSGAKLPFGPLDLFVRSGSTGVSLFLVISGFCLYLPYAGGRLSRFTSPDFFRRRARRLLPAYYLTVVVLVGVYAMFGGHAGLANLRFGGLAEQLTTHLTFTYQLLPSTFYGLNGAYWSLGLEWELYLTLPLLIVAVRRVGLLRTIAGVITLDVAYRLVLAATIDAGLIARSGALATDVLPNLFIGRWGEFAMGMLAAELYATGRAATWGRNLRYVALVMVPLGLVEHTNPLSHLLFGFVFFTVICLVTGGRGFLASVASWRPLVALGVMSYSLYLVHQPMVQVGAHFFGAIAGASPVVVFCELTLAISVMVFVAWVLFVTVESRTMGASARQDAPARAWLFPSWPWRAANG